MGKNKNNGPGFGTKIKSMARDVKLHWNNAPAGRYLSYKEAIAYCVGGMGAVAATVIPTFVTMAAGLYIAAALKINVDHIVLIGIITSIVTILRSPLMSYLIDNTQTKYGKFRPYLIWMPIPILLLFLCFGFLDKIPNYTVMIVVYCIIYNLMQFCMGLYSLAFTTLLQVISPKQEEKEWLMGFGAFVYSLGPSIINAGFPLIANLLWSEESVNAAGETIKIMGINTIGPYRWFVPLLLAICFALGYWTAFGCKERIVQAKHKKNKVKFSEGVKGTCKNKYFWLYNTSMVVGVFKLIGSSYVAWLCTYSINQAWAQSLFITIIGTAYTPGMLLAPWLIKKFGKKNLMIFSNVAVALMTVPVVLACIHPMAFTPYLIIALSYLIILVNSIQVVIMPAMNTQIYDYQQYKTGQRQEGFISQFGGIIGQTFGMATAFMAPAVYKFYGFIDDTQVLYNPDVLYPIIGLTSIVGVASCLLGTIPFFWWKLSEKRHTSIIEILKVRALHEEGNLTDDVAKELEATLEEGNNDALNQYIIEHPLEDSEDYISVKGVDELDKQEVMMAYSDGVIAAEDPQDGSINIQRMIDAQEDIEEENLSITVDTADDIEAAFENGSKEPVSLSKDEPKISKKISLNKESSENSDDEPKKKISLDKKED